MQWKVLLTTNESCWLRNDRIFHLGPECTYSQIKVIINNRRGSLLIFLSIFISQNVELDRFFIDLGLKFINFSIHL